ncbi:hypothetical protein STREPTOSP366_00380 [Streptomyces variabilis]
MIDHLRDKGLGVDPVCRVLDLSPSTYFARKKRPKSARRLRDEQLTMNFQHGKAEAMQEIAKAAKKPTEARAVIQTGMVIAGADGHFSQAEATALREACATLGLSPAEFQL